MKIAVLFGGESAERDVSIASGSQVVGALRSRGHEVIAVDTASGPITQAAEAEVFAQGIQREPPEQAERSRLAQVIASLADANFDLVFLALHGGSGENGAVQSLLDLHGLRYTGSGSLGSALAWDKDVSKQLFSLAGIPTPEWRTVQSPDDAAATDIELPVIVKPSGQGSTVGLSLVKRAEDLAGAILEAARFDRIVLVERYIAGRELTVGVLGDSALTVGEIVPVHSEIFDYEAKYQVDAAREIFPADVSEDVARKAQALALAAHNALRLSVYSRADFRMDASGELWCLEVNTLPGLSSGSLMPQSAAAAGVAFDELCERICIGSVEAG